MANSDTFGDDADAIASQHGEFLAGVLAMARISRVTVALESGADAGPALLAAARMTGHAETCLLFEDWEERPLAALAAAAHAAAGGESGALPDAGNDADALRDALRQAQARGRRSFLLILNRFERLLARPTHDPHYRAFEQALVALAAERELDLHLLLVMDESAEFLLVRLEHAMPGIGDGCLRIPAPGQAAASAVAMPAPPPRPVSAAGNGAARDRSFGMLLERLTAKAPLPAEPHEQDSPAEPAAAQPWQEPEPAAALGRIDAAPADAEPAAIATLGESGDAPSAPLPASAVHTPAGETALHDGHHRAPVPHSMLAPSVPVAPAAPPPAARAAAPVKRRRPWAMALALLLAVGAGMLVWRQQPLPDRPAAKVATPADAAVTPAPAPAAPVALASSAALSEPGSASPAAKPADAIAASKPAATSPAAMPAQAAPAVVYVHVRDAREREQIEAQRRALGAQNIRLMDVKIMSKGPSIADLRYFHDEDREEALAVQKALMAAGVPVARLSRMNGFESSTRRRHYEAWLSGQAQTARP